MGGHGAEHGHGHHHEPYVIPDYKQYKVEDAPLLLKTKKALAAQNLSDPWLRNEVWRYNSKQFGTRSGRISSFFFRGFLVGFAAFVATIAGTAAFGNSSKEHHEEHK